MFKFLDEIGQYVEKDNRDAYRSFKTAELVVFWRIRKMVEDGKQIKPDLIFNRIDSTAPLPILLPESMRQEFENQPKIDSIMKNNSNVEEIKRLLDLHERSREKILKIFFPV